MLWQRFPLFRLFLAFSTGIVLGGFLELAPGLVIVLCLLCLLGFLLSATPVLFFSFRFRGMFGVTVLLLFASLGVLSSTFYLKQYQAEEHIGFTDDGVYRVCLTQAPVNKGYAWRAEAKVVRADSSSVHTTALLYLQVDSTANTHIPHYGDCYLFKGKFNRLKPPQNPYAFDYAHYLQLRAVYISAFIPSSKRSLMHTDSTSFVARSILLRNNLLKHIEHWNLPARQEQISKALLVGYRDEVDADLLQAYSAVGAMHVLAVSGLHIGIVYLVLGKLLFFLRSRKARVIKAFLIVLCLWLYAAITGLSPSVVRAATMFTFVAVGVSLRRNTSVYNTLLASAMLLVMIKPTYLFEVGFQLSYLAVFGIVWLQPKLEKLWRPTFRPLKFVWDIVTVSVAAQVATFPLGLYYFHQFPGLFLLSNLLVLPLVTLLMYLGLCLLLLSVFVEPFSPLLWVYSKLLWLMNAGVGWVEGLDGWLIEGIHISRLELLLLYLFSGCCIHFCFSRKYVFLATALCSGIVLQGYQLWENYQLRKQEFVGYALHNKDALAFRKGPRLYFIADSSVQHNEALLNFQVKQHWWAHNVEEVMHLSPGQCYKDAHLLAGPDALYFRGVSVLKDPRLAAPSATLWWLTEFSEKLPEVPPSTGIVLSNLTSEQDKVLCREWARNHNVSIHLLSEQGAFQLLW